MSANRPVAHSKQGTEWLCCAGSAYPRQTESRSMSATAPPTSPPTALRDPVVATWGAAGRRPRDLLSYRHGYALMHVGVPAHGRVCGPEPSALSSTRRSAHIGAAYASAGALRAA
jgi:hypothetical protein